MTGANLQKLLLELDVNVEASSICEVQQGVCLSFTSVDQIEIHYVLKGTLHLCSAGAAPVVCGPGSAVVVPAGASQRIAADGNPLQTVAADKHCTTIGDGLLLYATANADIGDLRLVCGVVKAGIGDSFGVLDRVSGPMVLKLCETPVVDPIFTAMLDEVASPGLGSRAVLSALMKISLMKVLRCHICPSESEPVQIAVLPALRLRRAVAAVLLKPAAAFDVATLASIAGMSRSAFAREFLAEFAMTPMEFVRATRMHRAAGLLRSTNAPVKAIAHLVGFASRSHFSMAFRRAYGTYPRHFRSAANALSALHEGSKSSNLSRASELNAVEVAPKSTLEKV